MLVESWNLRPLEQIEPAIKIVLRETNKVDGPPSKRTSYMAPVQPAPGFEALYFGNTFQ